MVGRGVPTSVCADESSWLLSEPPATYPGLALPAPGAVSVEVAVLGKDVGWLRAAFPTRGAQGTGLHCEALLRRGGEDGEPHDSDDGAELPLGPGWVAVRSLACGEPHGEPSYVWEDATWL